MAFDGTEGGQITLANAATMTASHRSTNPNARLGHYIGKDILNSILAQPGCMGIRTYHGLNTKGKRELIFVGVDANENDMTTGIIGDMTLPCPSDCSSANDLNS